MAYWRGRLDGGESRASVLGRFQEAPGSISHLRVEVNVSVAVIAMFRRSATTADVTELGPYATSSALLAEQLFIDAEYYEP